MTMAEQKRKPGRPPKAKPAPAAEPAKAEPKNPAPKEVEVFIQRPTKFRAKIKPDGTVDVPIRGHIRFADMFAGLDFGQVPPHQTFGEGGEPVKPPKPKHPVTLTLPRELVVALCSAPGIVPPFDPPG